MSVIFLVTESEVDYDSSHHRNVKAFEKYIDAETLRFKLNSAQDRKNELSSEVRKTFMYNWAPDNPEPRQEYPDIALPKWNQKNGKKKGNPLLPAFEAEEAKVRAIYQKYADAHAVRYNEWETRALAATRALLVEAGMSEEEAATIDTIATYLHDTYYDYEVEEVELE